MTPVDGNLSEHVRGRVDARGDSLRMRATSAAFATVGHTPHIAVAFRECNSFLVGPSLAQAFFFIRRLAIPARPAFVMCRGAMADTVLATGSSAAHYATIASPSASASTRSVLFGGRTLCIDTSAVQREPMW